MELSKYLEKNPIVSMAVAYKLLAYATIIQHGLSNTEKLPNAIKRIEYYLNELSKKNEATDVKFIDVEEDGDGMFHNYRISIKEAEMTGRYDEGASTVNVIELLKSYNLELASDSIPAIYLSFSSVDDINSPTAEPSRQTILHLVETIAKITKNISGRDDKITNDTFDKIYAEFTNVINDSFLKSLLPEIKSNVKTVVDDKITKGRLSSTTAKKIQAAIYLAEEFKDKDVKKLGEVDCSDHLKKHNTGLSKVDREDVAHIYYATRVNSNCKCTT